MSNQDKLTEVDFFKVSHVLKCAAGSQQRSERSIT